MSFMITTVRVRNGNLDCLLRRSVIACMGPWWLDQKTISCMHACIRMPTTGRGVNHIIYCSPLSVTQRHVNRITYEGVQYVPRLEVTLNPMFWGVEALLLSFVVYLSLTCFSTCHLSCSFMLHRFLGRKFHGEKYACLTLNAYICERQHKFI